MMPALTRRGVLSAAAGAVASWLAPAAIAQAAAGKTLVFVCLRGGADGLSLLVPYREDGYYRARPRISIAAPGAARAASVRLDDRYALHPCLGGWQRLFERGELGARVDVGLRSRSRSHGAAQLALDRAITQALGGVTPECLEGGLEARLRELAQSLRPEAPRTVLLESFGWDTHAAQGRGRDGRLASAAQELERALLAFRAVAGARWQHVRLAVVTEFGRTLTESRTAGTEDAYASVMFTFGPEQSGRVLGCYDRVEPDCGYEERARPPAVDLQSELERWLRDEPVTQKVVGVTHHDPNPTVVGWPQPRRGKPGGP